MLRLTGTQLLTDLLDNPRHPLWGSPPLPDWLKTWFPEQQAAIREALAAYESGVKLVIISCPTGGGKTAIAEGIRRLLRTTMLYSATTHALQDQFMGRDGKNGFPYAAEIRGRANYPTGLYPDQWRPPSSRGGLSCADCDRTEGVCSYCPDVDTCPATVAREIALESSLICANTAYLLAETNHGRGWFSGQGFICCDEADGLETQLMGAVEVGISRRMQKLLNLDPPARKTVQSVWESWITVDAIPSVRSRLRNLPKKSRNVRVLQERAALSRLARQLKMVADAIPSGRWVYDGWDTGTIRFKPVTVESLGQQWLWQHADRWLLMSATIIDPRGRLADLGWPVDDRGSWAVIEVPCTFPVVNRPIFVAPIANMRRADKYLSRPAMVRALRALLDWHPFERVLIHSHSYEFADDICRYFAAGPSLSRPVLTYQSTGGKMDALTQYRQAPRAVLVAPSLSRGLDSPETGVVCSAKLPFPNLGEKAIQQRVYGTRAGDHWYAMETLGDLVQSTGRAVRSPTDTATHYILDSAFLPFYQKVKEYAPSWWKSALITEGDHTYRLKEAAGILRRSA